MSEIRMNEEMINGEVQEIRIDELSEEEVKELRAILERFIQKYKENPDRENTEWLREQLQEELPDRNADEIEQMATEIVESVREYDEDLQDLNANCKKGIAKESWFVTKIQEGATGVAINQFGNSLSQIDRELERANLQLSNAILSGNDDFSAMDLLAKRHHICDFNVKAVMTKSPYRACLCEMPGKSDFGPMPDGVGIYNKDTGEVLERYHVFSRRSSGDTTVLAKLFDNEDPLFNKENQCIVVPKHQVKVVQRNLPNKKVTSCVGGKKYGVESNEYNYSQIEKEYKAFQEKYEDPRMDWNGYNTTELVKGIGTRAGEASIHAALLGAGVGIAYKAFQGEKIEADELLETALTTGADAGVKCAASGALTVAVRKGALKIIPPGTPVGTIAKIASVGIENVKILWKVAKGELTMSEAIEHMGRASTAMYAGMTAGAVGAGVGAAAFSWIPVVGPVLGGVVGGMAGYMAGSKFGEKVYNGAKKVFEKGKELVKRGAEKIRDGWESLKNGIKNFLSL